MVTGALRLFDSVSQRSPEEDRICLKPLVILEWILLLVTNSYGTNIEVRFPAVMVKSVGLISGKLDWVGFVRCKK